MDCLLNFLQIYGSISSTIKHGLKKIPPINWLSKNIIINILLTIICLLTASIIFILLTIILLLLYLYKLLIILILKIRHGKNYGGVLRSADVLWIAEDETAYNIINAVTIVELDPKDDFIEYAKNFATNLMLKSKRLTSLRRFFMGYGYFISNQVQTEDIFSIGEIKTTSEIFNEEDLKKFVSTYANLKLPKDNKATFETIICQNKIIFENSSNNDLNKDHYAILFRFHHSVADGVSLMSILTGIIDGKSSQMTSEKLQNISNVKKLIFKRDLMRFLKNESYINTIFMKRDKNPLQIHKLTTEKHVEFKIGDNLTTQKVKTIRKKFNCTFSTVLYTAISQSLSDFFKKNHPNQTPNDLVMTFMVIPDRSNLHYRHSDIRNLTSVGNIRLPVKNMDLKERLQEIIKENKKYMESCDSFIYLWQLKTFCNLLPSPLAKVLIRSNAKTSIGFTNMPGIKKVQLNGRDISYLLFWVPNFITTGVGFSIFTYDDKLQVCFLVDKGLIPDEKDVKMVVNQIFVNIDKMYDEFCGCV